MDIQSVRVSNMQSARGNDVPNQFIVNINGIGQFFQSYNSIIVAKTPNGIILDSEKWDYSKTTGKYRNQFLNEGIAETRKKIASGVYKLQDLNA